MAEKNRRFSDYTYGANNPVRFIDVDGMIPGDFYDKSGKHIGSDGIDDQKKYVVFDRREVKTISENGKNGKKTSANGIKDKATVNGGCTTIEGVRNSVNAEARDSAPNANDAGLHEEGGDTQTDHNGNTIAVAWAPGPKVNPDGTGGQIDMFNGVSTPSQDQLLDSWHVHTSATQTVPDVDGDGGSTNRGSITPSGNPKGTDGRGDYGVARPMQQEGYHNTTIQVGTSKGTTVNFYNGSGIVGSMSYKAFLKMGDN